MRNGQSLSTMNWKRKKTTMIVNLDIDMELLKEQKQILLESIWDLEEQDKRFKLWGIVEMIDHIQDIHERE